MVNAITTEDRKKLASATEHETIDNVCKNNITVKKRILAYNIGNVINMLIN